MFDAAMQRIPSERNDEFTALLLATRAIIKHDTAGIRNAVSGSFELLDAADEARAELLDAARAFRADALTLAGDIVTLRGELQAAAASSLADRVELRTRVRRAEHRIVTLTVLLVVLIVELVYRYGAALLALLVSVIVMLGVW